ncbi:MAG: hypothetical protein P8Y61_06240 [Gammaproteobacteria bacterium]
MPLISVFAGLLAGGCASNTTVSSAWHEQNRADREFRKVIVVAVTDNVDKRMSFEDAVAAGLRNDETMAWPSARLMKSKQAIDEENMRRLVSETGADAVIVTTVSSLDVKAVESGGRSDAIEFEQATGAGMVPTPRQGNVFLRDYEENIEPVYITTEYTTVLTTDVYSAASGKNVYTVVSTARKQETLTEVIELLSDVIARRLRTDRVVK